MTNKICEFGEYIQNGVCLYLICNLTNDNCAFVRYCLNDRCLKMTDKYTKCKARCKEISKADN